MAVGTQSNAGSINQSLTSLAQAWRDLASQTLQQWAFLNNLNAAGLQALGFSQADAATVLYHVNHMATCAQVYKGTATQAALFNFEDSLTPLWAGQ